MSSEFHPQRSRISPTQLSDFLNHELTGNLLEVPGIGQATADLLSKVRTTYESNGSIVTLEGISSTYALMGIYLSFKSDRGRVVSPVEHTQRFYLWWCSLGTPGGYRAGTVHSICEKAAISFPGIYDPSHYM